ncbi:uncharacterized protein EV420DRAFT_1524030 [Desarmillaria tabescens]|uniref:F-box domain-containing protein n=1 Tax=Armillaria tabescens TaxID=1929756 RepID=A0AA39NB21_ARMTA|nr:uncharacterized protein EV420DRAFT_1524030 [Desarmillaria tabescens]KAK0462335.1 hypothetical protein EV420DRAFT_1524030 [Desarmillaria tabescens]
MISSYDSQLQSLESEEADLQGLHHDLKCRIMFLSRQMGTLRQERQRISEAISERRKILSPVRRLPSEILHHIFLDTIDFPVQYSQSKSNNAHWDFHPTQSSLWLIASVSKRWRNVALSSPKLWSFVNISFTQLTFDDLNYVQQLGLQLHRALKHPLSISLCEIDPPSCDEIPPQLIAILFSFASSIHELHLYLPSATLSDLTRLRLSLPALESLVVFCTDGIDLPDFGPLRPFSFVPKLRSVQAVDIIDFVSSFELPWHLVKEYRSDHAFLPYYPSRYIGPRAHEHLAVLRSLEQVEECVLRLGDASESDEFGDSAFPLVCSQLKSLELSSWNIDANEDHSVFQQVADRLTLPVLSVLKVSCAEKGNEETEAVFTSICHLLLRSHSPITVFHFNHCRALSGDLLQLFRSAHTLEDVRLLRTNSDFVGAEIIQELIVDHSSSKDLVLPRLHTLYISGTRASRKDLIRMVKSRWGSGEQAQGVERLLTLKLYGRYIKADCLQQEISSHLKMCMAGGFSLEIVPYMPK